MILTEQFQCPREYDEAFDRLTTLVAKHFNRLLADEYWSDEHLERIQQHSGQSYTYIRDDTYDAFEDVDEYVYSRFKRCVYARATQVLDAHVDEYAAFKLVTNTVEERKIRRIGWRRIRDAVFDEHSPFVNWSAIETVVEKLNACYDTHWRFPDEYSTLVSTPQPNGTISFAPDKGDYHVHDLEIESRMSL